MLRRLLLVFIMHVAIATTRPSSGFMYLVACSLMILWPFAILNFGFACGMYVQAKSKGSLLHHGTWPAAMGSVNCRMAAGR
jgi:hypothetical protein